MVTPQPNHSGMSNRSINAAKPQHTLSSKALLGAPTDQVSGQTLAFMPSSNIFVHHPLPPLLCIADICAEILTVTFKPEWAPKPCFNDAGA